MKLLKIEHLNVRTLEGKELVEPISFTLTQGNAITILGETGSGKSLLIQAIMGALPQGLCASGLIFVENCKFSAQSPCLQRLWGKMLAMLPQEPCRSLDPIMTIYQQLAESFRLTAGLNKNRANKAVQQQFQRLDLEQSQRAYPHQLSGGMAQRAAFAIATAAGGKILLADEPTKGLDQTNKQAVIDLLKQRLRIGGLLTITHDIEAAEQLGGDILVMKQGKLLEQGRASDILYSPKHSYTQALISADPKRWQPLQKIDLNRPLVTVKNLTVARGKRQLFRELSFSLLRGEILGIVGKSGIGKSTLANVLCGLLKARSGEIIWHESQHKPHQILKLYQDPPEAFAANVPLQTLLDDVIKRHRLDRSPIPNLLSQLGLSETILQRTAEAVSGGELQRIAILRALLLEPVLLFADEVSSRLDPITQQETINLLIEQARKRQFGLILVSHDRYLIEKSCDKVINLESYL